MEEKNTLDLTFGRPAAMGLKQRIGVLFRSFHDHLFRPPTSARDQEASAARYRSIVDTAVDAIIVADSRGRIQSFNPSAEKIFGYAAEEVVGENISMLMPRRHREAHDGYLANYRKTGERKIIGIGREVEGRRKDGALVPLGLSIAEWHDAEGRQCFTGIMRDISLRHQNEVELLKAKEEADRARVDAEKANQAKTDFLAVMSHEIRTPLTSISGFADLLAATDDLSPEQKRYIDLIRAANSALLTVVNDVLDFSKIEAGQMELESRVFSVKPLIHDTIAIVRPLAEVKGLTVNYSIARDVPDWMQGDPNRLRQVLLNLLNNAIKFTSEGTICLEMESGMNSNNLPFAWFSVSDTGTGIPRHKQSKLFSRFSQVDSSISRQYGGTGLGLAICKNLIELMEGEIGVNSKPGKGTQVWFTAHLPPADPPEMSDVKATVAVSPSKVLAAGRRVLLVDDLDTNREIASAYLERAGYVVDAAPSGPKAIRMLQKGEYDIVLMDIQMPTMDGMEATRCIRALQGPVHEIPIVAMTGNVLSQQVNSFIAAGMNDYVSKPIDPQQLIAKVARWTSRYSAAGAKDVPAGEPIFTNQSKLDELIDLMGPDKVEQTVRQFIHQLDCSFRSDFEAARREAHDLINAAGILGFDDFVDICRKVQWMETDKKDPELIISVKKSRNLVRRAAVRELLPRIHAAAISGERRHPPMH